MNIAFCIDRKWACLFALMAPVPAVRSAVAATWFGDMTAYMTLTFGDNHRGDENIRLTEKTPRLTREIRYVATSCNNVVLKGGKTLKRALSCTAFQIPAT